MLGASAPIREPMKKTKMAASSVGFRPKMSLSAPHGGAEAEF